MKLNLGSNNVRLDGFTNVDIVAHKNVDIVCDASDLKTINDCSVEVILASHLLEHFDFHQGIKAVKEWYRVLINGGKVIIEVPNLLAFCELFPKLPDNKQPEYLTQIFGYPWVDGQSHKMGYTPIQLRWTMALAGFKNIHQIEATRYTDIKDWCMRFVGEK